jgi:hypothetical protein
MVARKFAMFAAIDALFDFTHVSNYARMGILETNARSSALGTPVALRAPTNAPHIGHGYGSSGYALRRRCKKGSKASCGASRCA